MQERSDSTIRQRICPFISSGQFVHYCKGSGCVAAQPVLLDDKLTSWVCSRLEKTESEDEE